MPTSHSLLAAFVDDPSQQATEPRQRSAIFVVASPRPQTGKTFLARLVTDFLRMDGGTVGAFEVARGDTGLADFLPAVTTRAALDSTRAQIALFDRLIETDGVPKVVDLGHLALERFFGIVDEIGFIDEAVQRGLEVIVLYAADPHPASVRSYAELARRFPASLIVPVLNEGILKGRRLREHYPIARTAAVPLQIPNLPPGLRTHADRSGLSFVDFYDQLPMQIPLGAAFELRSWTKRTFLEFRELELRMLLEKLRASLGA